MDNTKFQLTLEKIFLGQKIVFLNKQLPKRTSHEVYFVQFIRDGKEETVVFKFHPNDVPEYKQFNTKKEAYVLKQLEKGKIIQVPKILYQSNQNDIFNRDYFVMEFIDGVPMSELIKNSSFNQKRIYVRELADLIATVHNIPTSQFPEIPKENYGDVIIRKHQLLYDGLIRDSKVINKFDINIMEKTITYLKNKKPLKTDEALLNGDFSPEHFIRKKDGTYVLVDWDPAEIGDRSWDIFWMVKEASQFVFGYENSLDDVLSQYLKNSKKPLENQEYYKNAAVCWAYMLGWYIQEKVPQSHLVSSIKQYRPHFSKRIKELI